MASANTSLGAMLALCNVSVILTFQDQYIRLHPIKSWNFYIDCNLLRRGQNARLFRSRLHNDKARKTIITKD